MNQEDHHTYKRASSAAAMGLAVQLLATVFLLVVGLYTDRIAVQAAAWYAGGGLLLWLMLVIVFDQHRRERLEALESEQLSQGGAAIFEGAAEDLGVHRRRLAAQYKWLLPIASFLLSAYLIGVGLWITTWTSVPISDQVLKESLTYLGMISAVVFLLFLLARYTAGMSKQTQWKLLSGGAGYLMGSVLVGVVLIACLALIAGDMSIKPMLWADMVVPVFMVVVGVEILLNLVLGFYRPRRAGEFPRAAFDSRLLSLLASPESITKTISETINYQFGFEITKNWFWQMLQRWFPKLVALAVVILLAITSLVVVKPNEMAVITDYHLGGRDRPVVCGPGLHLKAPWPLAKAEHYDVHGVRIIRVGTESDLKPEEEEPAILWTNLHTIKEPEPMIVTAALKNETADSNAPLVALVNVEIYLHYRIKTGKSPEEAKRNLLQYIRANADAESDEPADRRLKNLATRIVTRHLLDHTVDEWIGAARVDAGHLLRDRIQQAADQAEVAGEDRGLGVHILSVEVAGIHPPSKVAPNFHEVVAAGQKQKTAEQKARQEAIKILSGAAGSERKAREIIEMIDRLERLEKQKGADADETAAARKGLARMMRAAGGKASELIAEAQSERWIQVNAERGRVAQYQNHYEAWKNAPRWYAWNLYLQTLGEGMANARKFVVLLRDKKLILRGDFKKVDAASITGLLDRMQKENEKQP